MSGDERPTYMASGGRRFTGVAKENKNRKSGLWGVRRRSEFSGRERRPPTRVDQGLSPTAAFSPTKHVPSTDSLTNCTNLGGDLLGHLGGRHSPKVREDSKTRSR